MFVQGVSDGTIVSRMIHDVRRAFRHIVGGWRVTVRTSDRGRWRLELAGATGRHVWTFAAPAANLSATVVEKLEAFFHDSAVAWRPSRS